jgi:hypothetical protein
MSIGSLTCNHCTIGSLNSTGPLTLRHTNVKGNTSSIGAAEAQDCSLGAFNGTGSIDLKDSKIEGSFLNTGAAQLTNSQFKETTIIGKLIATSANCQSIHQTGHAELLSCTAKTGMFTGSLTAKKCSIEDLKVTAKTIRLTDCSVKSLVVRKQNPSKKTTVHIGNSPDATRETYIAKIMCEDPTTEIIYSANTRKADEIVGTTHITYA